MPREKEKPTGKSTTPFVLKPDPANPRRASQERVELLGKQLAEFGDLSGIVYNRRSQCLISGHQRGKQFERHEAQIELTNTYPSPTPAGTVAEGFIILDGERFAYREVDWPAAKAKAALLAANNPAGEWLDPEVKAILESLETSALQLTGFSSQSIAEIISGIDGADAQNGSVQNPQYPIIPKVLESYRYVVILADNDMDFTALCTRLKITPGATDRGRVAAGRVIWYKAFKAVL